MVARGGLKALPPNPDDWFQVTLHDLLVGLTALVVLGIGAQWFSWRLRLPAILVLLVTGFVSGPVTGLIDPDLLLGDILFPVVSLSVAIILFEGGLSLDVAELRIIGKVVRNLISVGVVATFALSAVFAHLFLGFDWPLSVLLGAILVVTGPTVIVPLLRHIKPTPRVGSAVKWEGIVNDPIGAILAVLVFEAIATGALNSGASVAVAGVVKGLLAGVVLGFLGAAILVVLMKRYWVPEFLQSAVALTVVVAAFTGSNMIQEEAGLLTVTVMGSALASQKLVSLRHIVEFKENLRVLLLSVLFILLAARLSLEEVINVDIGTILFIVSLILIVRPVAVLVSTWGSILSWPERVFLGFMAPRGIVAAAVSSLFAIQLSSMNYDQADRLATVVFLVIVATVAFYGLLAGPAARLLKVATPNPQGLLLAGAFPWVRQMAKAVQEAGVKVMLVDSNWGNVAASRAMGLKASYGNILGDRIRDDVSLEGMGRMLAVTPNEEVNSLAALQFSEVFGRENVYQLSAESSDRQSKPTQVSSHLRGRALFSPEATFRRISQMFGEGAEFKQTKLSEEFDFSAFKAHYGNDLIPLFTLKESGELLVVDADVSQSPKPGQTVVALVRDPEKENGHS